MKTGSRFGYIATVTDLYGSARYEQDRALALNRWPGVTWTEPARMGWSLDEWRQAWAAILPTLDLLVVFPRADLSIGRGCYHEIADCQQRSIPVYVLVNRRWCKMFEVGLLPGHSYRYWAKVKV